MVIDEQDLVGVMKDVGSLVQWYFTTLYGLVDCLH